MKIKELIDWTDKEIEKEVFPINKYLNEDCVIAYKKEMLGTIILIQGKRKPFAFMLISHQMNSVINGQETGIYRNFIYHLSLRIKLGQFFELFNKKDFEVVDEKLFRKIKRQLLLKKLE